MQVGDLFKLDNINGHTSDINRRTGIYLGEDIIHRDDGVTITNHRVLLVGDSQSRLFDQGLLKHMRVQNENR
mgnify:FL=1|jgi:hypothetical protein|tara:strand:- start:308 stop:523 length:216 start_codon:yes stop_codon:yes gene_type:complete